MFPINRRCVSTLRLSLRRSSGANIFGHERASGYVRRPKLPRRAASFSNSPLLWENPSSFFGLVFNRIPKGFGRFFPENEGEKKAENEATEKKEDASENRGSGAATDGQNSGFRSEETKSDGGNNDDKKRSGNDERPPDMSLGNILAGALTLLILYSLMGDAEHAAAKEISWQEFKNRLLVTGNVEKIVVVNKQLAKVYMRNHAGVESIHGTTPVPSSDLSLSAGSHDINQDSFDAFSEENRMNSNSDRNLNKHSSRVHESRSQVGYYFVIGSIDSFERNLDIAQRELGLRTSDYIPVHYTNETNWLREFARFIPSFLILGASLFFMSRMGGSGGGGMRNIFKLGKSTAVKIGKDQKVGVTFKDVAGCNEAKEEIMEFVQFLKSPAKFTKLGAKIPKGALLCGPPGTGKTLLAKATAGEASVPFFSISGSDFIEMFVGVGPSRVRDLFAQARKNAPCIVFIDEIDAVARSRSKGGFSGGNDERENTLNQLLVEMDGFDTKEGVVVLAGTNRVDILDQAILRPGRFDRQIKVDLPDIRGRMEIFMVHLKNLAIEGDITEVAQRLASLTPGFAGAQIANTCNEAAILAARVQETKVRMRHFEDAVDRVVGGMEKKNSIMSKEELRTVAFHEAGHAIVSWFLEHCDPLLKVTIIPRTSGALGFAQYLPKEMALHSEHQILDRMAMALGGRASEELNFGSVTTGASDDLDKVTKMAYAMVTLYGMNKRVGNISFPEEPGSLVPKQRYSEKTAELIDDEVQKIVSTAYERVKNLLTEKKEEVRKVAELLLEKETITQHDMENLIGKRPFAMPSSYEEFISASGRVNDKKATPVSPSEEGESGDPEPTPVLA